MHTTIRRNRLFNSISNNLESREMLASFGHDFNDGTFGDFELFQPNSAPRSLSVVELEGNQVAKSDWINDDTDPGPNRNRKSEFRVPIVTDGAWTTDFGTQEDLWIGFNIGLHPNYMRHGVDTEGGLMQVWGVDPDAESETTNGNWAGILKWDNGSGNLVFSSRTANTQGITDSVVGDINKGEWASVVMHIEPSTTNDGRVELWLNGEKTVDLQDTNIGIGDIENNVLQDDNFLHVTMGQYNYDIENWVDGEARTVFYDNIEIYEGDNGFNEVDPGVWSPEG